MNPGKSADPLQGIEQIADRVLFQIQPVIYDHQVDPSQEISAALSQPIGAPPLQHLVRRQDRILILADDLTRPTPRPLIFPHLLNELNAAGIPDGQIQVLIALGTHRAMREDEIQNAFSQEIVQRVPVINHDFRNPSALVQIGRTPQGTPITVNRLVMESDFILGVGSIVPHPEAGWSGGGKILQPGVCGEDTTCGTHMLAARQADQLALAGADNNPVRLEIEQVARQAGLRFIVNVIFDGAGKVVKTVAGDPVAAHRVGTGFAKKIFIRPIPKRADIVIVDSSPGDMDYWQGIKSLAFATRAVCLGGTVILVGSFPDGVSPIHKEFTCFSRLTPEQLQAAENDGKLMEGACAEGLYLHARIMQRVGQVICVSNGLSPVDKEMLGFQNAGTLEEALALAAEGQGKHTTIGVILKGGDVLPQVEQEAIQHGQVSSSHHGL